MKNITLLLLAVAALGSCSSRKKTNDSAFMKGFFSYYNTLFNSKDALETELRNRERGYKENFYAPYIPLFTEEAVADGTMQDPGMFGDDIVAPAGPGNARALSMGTPMSQNRNATAGGRKGASILEISEAKALKAIKKYSVLKNGEEQNPKIFDAHILLAKSRLYQGRPLDALDALNYVFVHMPKDKRLGKARIYEAVAYSKMQDYPRALDLFAALDPGKLKKDDRGLLSAYYAETLLQAGKKEEAAEALSEAFVQNKDRKLRSRIAFLRGQLLSELGEKEEARESFVTAYKYANDFEFEVKTQVEIAKTYSAGEDDYAGAQDYLEKMSRKGTYSSRKNEFYYALGLLATQAGKPEEAKAYFTRALQEKVSDPQLRGLTYYEIGKSFFDKSDYLSAGAYYDSALAVMTYAPAKNLLQERTENIKKVSNNYYLIRRNDSILALTRMPESERIAYFTKYIDELKAKEAIREQEERRAERSRGFDTGDYSANSVFAGNSGGFQEFGGSGKGSFYFANTSTVNKGESSFKQIWGNRALSDNWRTSARSNSIEDLKNEAMGLATAPDPRRLEPEFYMEKIPTRAEEILALKKARDTAALGLGTMYENYFSDTPLATKTLTELVENNPEEEVKLQALYHLFVYNYEKNAVEAERAKQTILQEFPYTSYAEFVRNPKNNTFSQSAEEVEKLYQQAFASYEAGEYEKSRELVDQALQQYPKDGLVPKFTLLNAFNTGKTAGKEIMILQLEQLVLNYPNTAEGQKAAGMLKYLQSDLELEERDAQGNSLTQPVKPEPGVPQVLPVGEEDPGVPVRPRDPRRPVTRPGSSAVPGQMPDNTPPERRDPRLLNVTPGQRTAPAPQKR